jgi:hypothetical protein
VFIFLEVHQKCIYFFRVALGMREKINITPIALSQQRPTEIKEGFVELDDNFLRYKIDFVAEELIISDDPLSGWKPYVQNHFDILAQKKFISGIEKSLTKDGKWAIYIIVSGFATDIKIYYKSQTSAQ